MTGMVAGSLVGSGNSLFNMYGMPGGPNSGSGALPVNVGDEGLDLGSLGTWGKLGSLGVGLAGAYNAYNTNKLREKAFKFQKGATNRNIANQAVVVNNQLSNQASMQAQLFGNKVGTRDYQNYLANNTKTVNGAAI